MNDNMRTLESFTLDSIPDLDVAVLGALELFQKGPLPDMDIDAYKRPLVVGSGNAEATGRILFRNADAIFASESTYRQKFARTSAIDGVALISASGGKHAPSIAQTAREYEKPVTLITNTRASPASRVLKEGGSREYVFPKNREPYTYNTSTYMGMIMGSTKEDPAAIYRHLTEVVAPRMPDMSSRDKFFLIVPPRFSEIVRMLEVKFIELFGRRIARDVETSEYMKHAVTVVPSDELFISFGEENTAWGKPENRLHVPLPDNSDYGTMMAVGYYVIAQIQKQHPPYFKNNIEAYTKTASEAFGESIVPIVE